MGRSINIRGKFNPIHCVTKQNFFVCQIMKLALYVHTIFFKCSVHFSHFQLQLLVTRNRVRSALMQNLLEYHKSLIFTEQQLNRIVHKANNL